jgi:hypothetical protein
MIPYGAKIVPQGNRHLPSAQYDLSGKNKIFGELPWDCDATNPFLLVTTDGGDGINERDPRPNPPAMFHGHVNR